MGREDPRPRRARCATGRSRARSATSSSTTPRALFVDPAGEARAHRPVRAADRRDARVRRGRARGAARAGDDDVRARGRAAAARCSTTPGIADALAALPVYRTYVEPWTGRVERRRPRGGRRGRASPGASPTCCCSSERGHDEFVTRFQQTTPPVMAKGVEDTAFYRYVRLLALNEVGGDPARFGHRRSTTSTPRTRSARERFPRGLLVTADARHEALGRRARADRRARRDGRRVARARAALARAQRGAARRRRARRQRGVPDLPDARRRLADRPPTGSRPTSRRRCARPSATRAGSSRTTTGRRAVRRFARRAARPRAVPRRLRAVRRARRRGGRGAARSASCC